MITQVCSDIKTCQWATEYYDTKLVLITNADKLDYLSLILRNIC